MNDIEMLKAVLRLGVEAKINKIKRVAQAWANYFRQPVCVMVMLRGYTLMPQSEWLKLQRPSVVLLWAQPELL